ncbi:MAG TPA: hypothetical protein VGJ82_17245 [Thermoanaerobaculia bacterium]|jgi:hypothetical protein
MKRVRLVRGFVEVLLLAVPLAATAQTMLECPGAASVSHFDTFHFHTQMYRPDTRVFIDLWGTNQFASQAACERARDAQMKRNLTVVNYFRTTRGEQNYEADRFGLCHCDMSPDKTNPRYLAEPQRDAQLRLAEEVRQRVRERLLDSGLQSDSEIVRSAAAPMGESVVGLPRMVKVPASSGAARVDPDDLKATKAVEKAQPSAAALDDLPLVDVGGADLNGAAPPPPPSPVPIVATTGGEGAAAPLSTPPPAPLPMAEVTVAADEDAAETFISSETQRIQNVLKASAAIGDEDVKAKIYEACMQRIQLLSNLRTLIQTAGAKSRLADFARNAHSETERLAFVGKLFGDDMRAHWAPADARDVILPANIAEGDPEQALRDASGKVTNQQKKHALYVFLARSQPTEEQQLWLSTVADSLLQ